MAHPVELEDLWEGFHPRNRRGSLRRGPWTWALRSVSLHVAAAETLGVIGPNGAGKSTLLRSIAGVLSPTRGRVATIGRVSSLIDLGAGVNTDLSGRENLLIGGVLLGMRRAEVKAKYDEIVDFSGVEDAVLSAPALTHSMGQALRIAISVVLHSGPDVLLVDEILAAADEQFRQKTLERIESMRAGGCAVVLVSHDLAMIEAMCSRVVVLREGEIALSGQTEAAVAAYRGWAGAPS
jgi:ABC-type polysaccharide/polyol phosphate transport system ATPase subunit